MRFERGGFVVTTRVSHSELHVSLMGEIDLAVVEGLGSVAASLAEHLTTGQVTIDLTGVTFADVAGSAAVWRMRDVFRRAGAAVEICGADPAVMRVFVLLGLPMSGGGDLRTDGLPAGLSGTPTDGLPRHVARAWDGTNRREH